MPVDKIQEENSDCQRIRGEGNGWPAECGKKFKKISGKYKSCPIYMLYLPDFMEIY
jgi:hypothetical protein